MVEGSKVSDKDDINSCSRRWNVFLVFVSTKGGLRGCLTSFVSSVSYGETSKFHSLGRTSKRLDKYISRQVSLD